jgi:hypothetical protein
MRGSYDLSVGGFAAPAAIAGRERNQARPQRNNKADLAAGGSGCILCWAPPELNAGHPECRLELLRL